MPRKPRMFLPGVPNHIVQRGNNREATFFSIADYNFYLECLLDAITKYKAEVHAYVLMTNHVHILLTPHEADSMSLIMQSIGRRYVQYINKRYFRTGTLWEGRYKASLVDSENYLLACSRYIELNPVTAKMVSGPEEYPWSSFGCNGLGNDDPLISAHEVYKRLGSTVEKQRRLYRALFSIKQDKLDGKLIGSALNFSVPTGDKRFQQQIQKAIGRKVGYAKTGRPIKNGVSEGE